MHYARQKEDDCTNEPGIGSNVISDDCQYPSTTVGTHGPDGRLSVLLERGGGDYGLLDHCLTS